MRRMPAASGACRARPAATVALLLFAAALAGCGQRGPLTLPASAQPIKRLPPAGETQPPAQQAQPQAAPPAEPSPPPPRQDEDRTENER